MENIEKFIRYNLVRYMKNYSVNLQESERTTSIKTFNFFFELSTLLLDNYSDLSPEFLEFEEGFRRIEKDYTKLLEELVDTNQTSRGNSLDDEEIELLQSISERRYKRIAKSKLRNKSIDQDLILKFLSDFNALADRFLGKSTEEVPEKFLEIYTLFQLSSTEIELLKVIYIAERCNLLNEHVFHCDDKYYPHRHQVFETDYSSKRVKVQHVRIEYVTNVQSDIIRTSFKENSKLFLTGLIENERDPNLSEFLIDYLEGITKDHFFSNIFEAVNLEDAFPLTTNQVAEKELVLIQKMLNSKIGISILLKGKPGTGKTELVKSIAKKVGMPLFNLRHSRKKSEKSIPPRKMALYLVQQLYGDKEAIFLVDECEDLINSLPSFRFFRGKNEDDNLKSFINEYLDENRCKFFFVANNTEEVDESTKRRFNYILTFNDVSSEHRETLLKNLFQKENADFLSEDEVKSLAFSSKLNIGHFGLALTTIKTLEVEKSQKKDFFLDIINNLLNPLYTLDTFLISFIIKLRGVVHEKNKVFRRGKIENYC